MKGWLCFLLFLAGRGFAGAQTVGDRPTRFMMIVEHAVMVPLKSDLLGDIGLRPVRPALSGGLHYYFNENWGTGLEGHGALLTYVRDRKKSFYRKEYIPERYQEMKLKGGRRTLESSFIAGGAFYRKSLGGLWWEAGLLAGTIVFETPSEHDIRTIYYKEEGTNFVHEHTVSDLREIRSFVISPQISAQYKLNSRLGLALNLGVLQPFRKVGYTMKLTDIFYQEENVVESYQGKVNAPMFYSRIALILNFRAIKKED